MNSSKLFKFMEQKSEDVMEIIVPEYINPEYGMYVWPCAPVLAQFIWKNRQKVENKNVLEIGAGTALPGIMAAKCGADVILSDSARLLECQQNCRRTCLDNNIKDIPVIGLTWGEFNPSLLELGNIDIILASDCFYETKDFEEVIVTVSFILKRNPLCEFWCTYQERSSDRSIVHLLKKWNLKSKCIPLEEFGADTPHIGGSDLPGNHTILMFIVTLISDSND